MKKTDEPVWVPLYQTGSYSECWQVSGVHPDDWQAIPADFEHNGYQVDETWESVDERFRAFAFMDSHGNSWRLLEYNPQRVSGWRLADVYGRLHREYWVHARANAIRTVKRPVDDEFHTVNAAELVASEERAEREYDAWYGVPPKVGRNV